MLNNTSDYNKWIEEYERIMLILSFKYYRKWSKSIILILFLTRTTFLKKNGKFLLYIQRSIALTLSKLQKTVQEGESLLTTESDERKKKVIERRVDTHRQLINTFQTIVDGIAWRAMSFNRPLLRLFSENDSPGHIEKEIDLIFRIRSKNGEIIIINDLTRFCRISDLTLISKDKKIILLEAKTPKKFKGKKIILKDYWDIIEKKNKFKGKFSRQELRQIVAQKAIINNKITIPLKSDTGEIKNFTAEILNVDIPIKHYFNELKSLIKEAKEKFYACRQVEDGYFIEVKAYKTIFYKKCKSNFIDYAKAKFQEIAPEWVKDKVRMIIKYNSYFSLIQKNNHFSRNIIPYSILPLSVHDCYDLISGNIQVIIYYNPEYLKSILEKNGWEVKINNFEELIKNQNFRESTDRVIFKKIYNDTLFDLSKEKGQGTFKTTLLLTELLQAISSFYSTDFLIDSLGFRLLNLEDKEVKKTITLNYPRENKIFI